MDSFWKSKQQRGGSWYDGMTCLENRLQINMKPMLLPTGGRAALALEAHAGKMCSDLQL